jgi:phosphatidylethanolamine/phosphatidyl-N-methylethanolamine N-methyltransferase
MENEDQAWLDYRQRFAGVYDQANYASPLQAWVMRAGHRLAEKPFGPEKHFGRVLEIGAGTGEHYTFVRHSVDQYILSDSDPEALAVAKRKLSDASPDKLGFELQSAQQLSHPERSFDRVIATHVLEHINQPHLVLKEWRRVVKDSGTLTVLIPTDPGIAWRLGRRLGPRRNAIAQSIAYDYVMAREHVNSCTNLIALLRHYFPNSQEAWWPLPIPSVDLNLFFAFHAVVRRS